MEFGDILQISATIIASLGGGALIVFSMSSWLGKVWANRLMQNERASHEKNLAELQSSLQKEAEHNNHLLKQKIELYKEVAEPVIKLITNAQHHGSLQPDDLKIFDSNRLSTTALLAMFAPQEVFNKYNDMIDYIYDSVEGKETWSFSSFRDKALIFLSEVRRDVGLYQDEITYSGTRQT